MADRAASAPISHDLAGAARTRARQQRRRRAEIAGGLVAASATALAGGYLAWQHSPGTGNRPAPVADQPEYEQLPLPTRPVPVGDYARTAFLNGVLVRSRDNCLYVLTDSPDRPLVGVVWPYGYSARRAPGARAEVLDEHGTVVLSEGDKLAVGGGYGSTPSHPCKIPYRQSFWMDVPPWRVPD